MSEKIVQLNEEIIKGQIRELVCSSADGTMNELLEKETESLTRAARYKRSEVRRGYCSGHYDRNLTTTSGDVAICRSSRVQPSFPSHRFVAPAHWPLRKCQKTNSKTVSSEDSTWCLTTISSTTYLDLMVSTIFSLGIKMPL